MGNHGFFFWVPLVGMRELLNMSISSAYTLSTMISYPILNEWFKCEFELAMQYEHNDI